MVKLQVSDTTRRGWSQQMFKMASVSLHEHAFVPHTNEVCSILKTCRIWVLHSNVIPHILLSIYFLLKWYLHSEPRSKRSGLMTCGGSPVGPFQPVWIVGLSCSNTMAEVQWHHQVSCRVHLPITRSTPMCIICILKWFRPV